MNTELGTVGLGIIKTISEAQWSSGSVSYVRTTGPVSIPVLDNRLSLSSLLQWIDICVLRLLRYLKTGVSLQIDHLIGTSDQSPQRPMVTYTVISSVVPCPHRLLRH
ncbi:hypothetical protein TNCV_256261 [Trichonephila clavipes]|nr:hypothetical protein TNCV_256261 [Trichonephila clavipes]